MEAKAPIGERELRVCGLLFSRVSRDGAPIVRGYGDKCSHAFRDFFGASVAVEEPSGPERERSMLSDDAILCQQPGVPA